MSVLTISSANFEEEVMKCEKPVLLDLWAPWCGPCRMLGPIIEEIANDYKEIKVGKINVDENQGLAVKFDAMSIPLVVILNKGEVVAKSLGVVPKQNLVSLIQPLIEGGN